jgi:hypothetical protein
LCVRNADANAVTCATVTVEISPPVMRMALIGSGFPGG